MQSWLRNALVAKVPRDHRDAPEVLRRRQWVTGIVVVIGGIVLGLSLRLEPGSPWFYAGSLGPLRACGPRAPSPPVRSTWAGSPAATTTSGPSSRRSCSASAWPGCSSSAGSSCARSRSSPARSATWSPSPTRASIPLLVLITAVTGAAEELFFRGAAYAATPRHPVLVTTALYTLATFATGNVMLTFAAVLLGLVVGLERRASGGILAPDPHAPDLVAGDAVRAAGVFG